MVDEGDSGSAGEQPDSNTQPWIYSKSM